MGQKFYIFQPPSSVEYPDTEASATEDEKISRMDFCQPFDVEDDGWQQYPAATT